MPKVVVIGSFDNIGINFPFFLTVKVEIGAPTLLRAISHQGDCSSFEDKGCFGSGRSRGFSCQ
jgi:hypothetical protein